MSITVTMKEKWKGFTQKFQPVRDKWQAFRATIRPVTEPVGKGLRITGKVLYHLRKVFLALPVVYYAVKFASYNMENLPEQVGLNLQSTGEFAQMISREAAVYGPLGITAVCLLLMFLSRRVVYPWIISALTLILPILVLITNQYPM